jgi:hypothetical protein
MRAVEKSGLYFDWHQFRQKNCPELGLGEILFGMEAF